MSYAMMGLGQIGSGMGTTDEALAAQANIPVAVLRAIRSVESGGNASSIRFEPHVFWREINGLPNSATGGQIRDSMTAAQFAQVPYTPCTTSWRTAHGLSPCMRGRPPVVYNHGASLVGSETNRAAFDRARRVNAEQAIKATSWGLYQVLGEHLLNAFPGSEDPVAAFYADPLDTSNRMLISWFRSRPSAVAAARATPPNFGDLAEIYNGSLAWGVNVARAFARGDMGVVSRGAARVVTETVTEHPVPVAIGVAVLGAGAAFAWWAYSKRKVKRNRRRRASRRISRMRRNAVEEKWRPRWVEQPGRFGYWAPPPDSEIAEAFAYAFLEIGPRWVHLSEVKKKAGVPNGIYIGGAIKLLIRRGLIGSRPSISVPFSDEYRLNEQFTPRALGRARR